MKKVFVIYLNGKVNMVLSDRFYKTTTDVINSISDKCWEHNMIDVEEHVVKDTI